jgi:hypothetical protein
MIIGVDFGAESSGSVTAGAIENQYGQHGIPSGCASQVRILSKLLRDLVDGQPSFSENHADSFD